MGSAEKKGNPSATLAIACAILGILGSPIPFVSWILAGLGLFFATIGLIVAACRKGAGLFYAGTAFILCLLPFALVWLLVRLFFA